MTARTLGVALSLGLVTTAVSAAEVAVYAAGSLRSALTDVAQAFERASGHKVVLTFGASGLLRDRIRSGERADVFASANMEHPQALAALGWTERVDRFARNTMCVLARPEVDVSTGTVLHTMLDPKVRLGTSTPKADPSGDYAWQVFHKADVVRPGSFATLSAKAMQLTGGPQSPPPPRDRSVYGVLLAENRADVFLTYCTNAELSRKEQNYRNRRAEDIEETVFRVVVRGGNYEIVVDDQTAKR